MDIETLNANDAEVVQPQTEGAETADFTQPQETADVDVKDMTDAEFAEYINSIKSGIEPSRTAQTAEEEVTEAEDEPVDAEQETDEETETDESAKTQETVFKSYSTKEEWQADFDAIIGERLKKAREKTATLDKLEAVAKDYYGTDTPLDALMTDLVEQTAERRQMTAEEYERHSEMRRKADAYDAQMQQAQMRQAQEEAEKALLEKWQEQSAELKKTVPNFDFEKALENKAFYDRVVKGYSVSDAWALTNPPQTAKAPRKPVVQSAARKQTAADTADVDVWSMSDADFKKYIRRCERGDL